MGDASWTNWGWPRWQMVTALFIGWVICYLCLIRGVQSMGKIGKKNLILVTRKALWEK